MRQGRSFGVETVVGIGGKRAAPPAAKPNSPLSALKKQPRELAPSPSHLPRPLSLRGSRTEADAEPGRALSLPP